MNQKASRLLAQASLFRCPICHQSMTAKDSSLICESRHTFNLSKKGHVNFVAGQKPLKYTRELFAARERILQAGFYLPLLETLQSLIEIHRTQIGGNPLVILDAGCGQGYYTRELAYGTQDTLLGFDLSQDAIAMAASGVHPANFFVADLTNIPLQDASQDLVIDLLTQANYAEFRRVLRPGGLLIKIIPGPDYLKEIRQLLGGSLLHESHSDDDVLRHFQAHCTLTDSRSVYYSRTLEQDQARDMIRMTPMALGVDPETLPTDTLHAITIDLRILIGSFPQTGAEF